MLNAGPAVESTPASLAEFAGARVLLMGTGTHAPGSRLPDVLAVADTLADLRTALVRRCGLAEAVVRVVLDPATAQVMVEAVEDAVEEAEGLLLVYYVGHGLVSPSGDLFLASSQTGMVRPSGRVSRIELTALPYALLRNMVLDSRPRSLVVVLDCCFSGRALDGLADPGAEVANLAQVAGGFVLTAAGGEEVALAPAGERHTAFTGMLLKLLNSGDVHSPQWLTLRDVYRYLTEALPAAGYPRPRLRSSGEVANLVVAANPAYRSVRQATAVRDPDRLGRAGELLRSEILAERVAGVAELARLAVEHPDDGPGVLEALAGFVRQRANSDPEGPGDFPDDLQAALEVIRATGGAGIDLHGARLSGADLSGMSLRGASLNGTDLRYANLANTDLSHASLRVANLLGARLDGADLMDADLSYANLNGASTDDTDIDVATAHLENAILNNDLHKRLCDARRWDEIHRRNAEYPYIW